MYFIVADNKNRYVSSKLRYEERTTQALDAECS